MLHVGTLTPRRFTDGDANLLQLAADRAALAIEQAALYEQRRLAEAVQRRLLPERLAAVPKLCALKNPGDRPCRSAQDPYRIPSDTGRVKLVRTWLLGSRVHSASVPLK